jgi:hypothetical protein
MAGDARIVQEFCRLDQDVAALHSFNLQIDRKTSAHNLACRMSRRKAPTRRRYCAKVM